MRAKYWLFESAVLLAIITATLYMFGHYYDYRLRFEFNLQTIPMGLSYDTLLQNGAAVVIGWFANSAEFWLALIIVLFILGMGKFVEIKESYIPFRNVTVFLICLMTVYYSVSQSIPDRAKNNADSIRSHAAKKLQHLVLEDNTGLHGYTIISTMDRLAFLSNKGQVRVVLNSRIKQIDVTPKNNPAEAGL